MQVTTASLLVLLHHLLQFFFLNKQRHVNKLQPWGMTVGQVSFISSLEWNKHAFTPHTTPHRDHQCCLTWIPVSEIGHNMHMDPSVFVFPVKILRISAQFCFTSCKSAQLQQNNTSKSHRFQFIEKMFSLLHLSLRENYGSGDMQILFCFCF